MATGYQEGPRQVPQGHLGEARSQLEGTALGMSLPTKTFQVDKVRGRRIWHW